MKRDEKPANSYLNNFYGIPQYEPDGNRPPDFSIDGNIGIEVRRLNQQHRENGNPKGLSEVSIPLRDSINKELLRHAKDDRCYWLSIKYKRSFGPIKSIVKGIAKAIEEFESNGEIISFPYPINDNFLIKFAIEGPNTSQKYNIATVLDMDRGGFVIQIYIDEINHCIKEKETKIMPYLSEYNEWWLLLVDYIGFWEDVDVTEIKKHLTKPSCFSKVLIIDVIGEKLLLEI